MGAMALPIDRQVGHYSIYMVHISVLRSLLYLTTKNSKKKKGLFKSLVKRRTKKMVKNEIDNNFSN